MSTTQCVLLLATLAVVMETKKIIRAQEGAITTGKFIIKLSRDTSTERFNDLVDYIEHESEDSKIYRKVNGNFTKIITAKLSEAALEMIKDEDNVDYIEEETMTTIDSSIAYAFNLNLWHLDRIDQRYHPIDFAEFHLDQTGREVDIYIIDSGIHYTHDEFGGRALDSGFDAIDDGRLGDCNGHGTHVAALAGGSTYGVARDATLYNVRVFDCWGKGEVSAIVEGLNYAAERIANSTQRGIINMSLRASINQVLNDEVEAAVTSGVPVIVAAGNDNRDACSYSPASEQSAITVAATRFFVDRRAPFSNYGSCVDIFAPGEGITSASNFCDSCTDTRDGTSMAAPIVTGVAAAILEARPTMSVAELTQYLIDTSTKDVIEDVKGSPNRFVFAASI